MSTLVLDHPPPNFAKWLFPLLGLIILFGLMLMAIGAVGMNTHSITRHGISEVSAIHNCLNNNEPYMTFRATSDPNRFYQVCELPDGRFGLRVVQHEGGGVYEHVTSFIKGNGTWPVVRDYLLNFATKFTGVMP